jgi:ADP-heptose:LPS heptosyltransferase
VAKFLIVRFSSIGDIVLTTPVIRCLKQQLPDAEIHFLTRKGYSEVLRHHPLIGKLWTTDGSLEDVADALQAENFDYIIDLHHNLRSLRLRRRLGVRAFAFPKLNIEKWLLVNLRINRLPDVHIVDRYLSTLSTFGVKNDGAGLDYYTGTDAEAVMDRLPATHREGYLAVAIGAQHSTKMMPSEKIARVLKKLALPAVLLGGKEDRTRAMQIMMAAGDGIWSACGETNIHESAVLLRQARAVLSHDTGLMHIAAAFRRPLVTVWGNTVPAFGMYPYMPGNSGFYRLLQVEGLRCRPCSKIGYDKCPKGHFQCMRALDDDIITDALRAAWTFQGS